MWQKLSLRTRLLLPLGTTFVAALLLGAFALQIFAPIQLIDENEPATRSARAIADALNNAIRVSTNPEQTLDAFAQSLGTSEAIRFRRSGTGDARSAAETRVPPASVPHWFLELIEIPEIDASFPISITGKRVGEIVFSPDLSADIYEKWVGFLAIVTASVALMLLTGGMAYLTVGATLAPLQNLGEGLSRMRNEDYDRMIPETGPPEIRKSAEQANELARELGRLSRDNRSLLRKIVSLQDDERSDIARELHDELGPLLFGIRANAVSLVEAVPQDSGNLQPSVQGVLESVEALQHANRRILDRLRPLYIQELGLENSIQTLLAKTRSQAPSLELTSRIDPRLNEIDGLLSQTVYRVIQEAVTNVLRHANAGSMQITANVAGRLVSVEISDDGVGFTADATFGRGLTGMQERVRALSGAFELLRENGRTYIRCRLPAGA